MGLAFSGCHRTGKTTLAKALAKELGVEFVPTITTKVFEREGLDPKNPKSHEEVIHIQNLILDEMIAVYEKATTELNGVFVTDRSPFDCVGYMIANIDKVNRFSTITEFQAVQVANYSIRALDVAKRYLSFIYFVEMGGIPLVDEKLKGDTNKDYMNMVDSVIKTQVKGMFGAIAPRIGQNAPYLIFNQVTDTSMEKSIKLGVERLIRSSKPYIDSMLSSRGG